MQFDPLYTGGSAHIDIEPGGLDGTKELANDTQRKGIDDSDPIVIKRTDGKQFSIKSLKIGRYLDGENNFLCRDEVGAIKNNVRVVGSPGTTFKFENEKQCQDVTTVEWHNTNKAYIDDLVVTFDD